MNGSIIVYNICIMMAWYEKKKESVHLSVNLSSASKYSFKPTQTKKTIFIY